MAVLLLLAPRLTDGGRALEIALFLVAAWCVRPGLRRPGRLAIDAAALMLGLHLAYLHVPAVWHAVNMLTGPVDAAATMIAGGPRSTGPLHAGIWTALFLGGYGALTMRDAASRGASFVVLVAALVLPVLIGAGGVWIGAQMGSALQQLFDPPFVYLADQDQPRMIPPAVFSSWSQVLALIIFSPLAVVAARVRGERTTSAPGSGLFAAIGAVSLIAGGALLAFVPPLGDTAGGRIGFLNRNLDFSVPEPGRYGLIQAGMFGSTRDVLEQSGYEVVRVEPETLEQDLQKLSVFVAINLQEQMSDETRGAIWRWVEQGGGLMVMGDHTDLFGLMAPTNALLEPIGVRFIFDSAYPLRRHFANGVEMRRHPVTAGLRDNHDLQIGTGGSLVLDDWSVEPVVVGRYAFSDFGNRLNDGKGGLLGNYQHEHGEKLGDLVLVAAAEYGRGRVIVFGDTTTFQVLSMPHSAQFAERTFRYLSGRWADPGWTPVLGLGLIAAGAVAAFVAGSGIGLAGAAGAVAIGAAFGGGLDRPAKLPDPREPDRMALIDVRHVPAAPLSFFTEGAVGGFYTAIQRAGYTPISDRGAEAADLESYGLVAYLDPAQPLNADERAGLSRLMERGGTILVTAGWPRRQGATDVLELCGMALEATPLGPAKPEWSGRELEFVDAWPLRATGGAVIEPVVSWHDMPIVAETRFGAGRCVAIGDNRFFQDAYFEGEYDFHPVNVRFIDELLRREEAVELTQESGR